MLLSGGVDSSVCAALLHKALKEDQVIAVHVDNGFMRKNESKKVEESLRALGLKVKGMLFCGSDFKLLPVVVDAGFGEAVSSNVNEELY